MRVDITLSIGDIRRKLNYSLDQMEGHRENKDDRRGFHFETGRASAYAESLADVLNLQYHADFGDFPAKDVRND